MKWNTISVRIFLLMCVKLFAKIRGKKQALLFIALNPLRNRNPLNKRYRKCGNYEAIVNHLGFNSTVHICAREGQREKQTAFGHIITDAPSGRLVDTSTVHELNIKLIQHTSTSHRISHATPQSTARATQKTVFTKRHQKPLRLCFSIFIC